MSCRYLELLDRECNKPLHSRSPNAQLPRLTTTRVKILRACAPAAGAALRALAAHERNCPAKSCNAWLGKGSANSCS